MVEERFDRIDRRFDPLDRHLRARHEETFSRIAAISENWATKADIQRVIDKIDELDHRLVSLEVAVGSLSRERKARGPRRG